MFRKRMQARSARPLMRGQTGGGALRACLWQWLCGAALVLNAAPVWSQTARVRDLPTRLQVTQRYLWLEPERFDATVLLLVGGNGLLAIADNGALGAGAGNFLARSRAHFLQQGLAVALVDAPSDRQIPPYLTGFRQGPEHATDLLAVLADIHRRTGRPVVLVGTSWGTQSAAALAIASADTSSSAVQSGGPDALVLTSSILSDPRSRALPQMELEKLRLPVLVVHHQQDNCGFCQYADLPQLTARLKTPYKVLTYEGGKSTGDPCEAFAYHGYNGIEVQVVQDITSWIRLALRP